MSDPRTRSAALRVDGLGHAYGRTPVLRDVAFDVAPGELVAVLGASGCGKTTLLRSIAGLLLPRDGRIEVDGVPVCQGGRELVPVERRGVGLVFQDYALFPHMSVADNVAFGLPGGRDRDGRVGHLLALAGLEGLADRRPDALSGGQQQRVALVRALAPRPHLLLLDEPFSNVDAERRGELGLALRRLLRAEGAAALLVTHDRGDALQLADRVVAVVRGEAGGEVAQISSPEHLYREPASEAVARLTGPASVVAGDGLGGDAAIGAAPGTGGAPGAGGGAADTAVGRLPLAVPALGPVEVVLRPEQVAFQEDPAGPCTVEQVAFVGRAHRLRLSSAAGPLLAEGAPVAVGARGRITLRSPAWALSRP